MALRKIGEHNTVTDEKQTAPKNHTTPINTRQLNPKHQSLQPKASHWHHGYNHRELARRRCVARAFKLPRTGWQWSRHASQGHRRPQRQVHHMTPTHLRSWVRVGVGDSAPCQHPSFPIIWTTLVPVVFRRRGTGMTGIRQGPGQRARRTACFLLPTPNWVP